MTDQRRSPETLIFPGFPAPDDSRFMNGRDDVEDDAYGDDVSDPQGDEEVLPADIDEKSDAEGNGQNDEAASPEAFEKMEAEALRWSSERVHRTLESLLFVADRPLTEDAVRKCTGLDLRTVRGTMRSLQAFYDDSCRGIVLAEVAGGWQFRTNAEASAVVRRFLKVKPQRLTRAALETLAIVAYRQPVTRAEIEDIRAVDSGAVLKALLERRLVRIMGKKDEVGRPLIYGTTREFLEFFSLKDLSSLPTLKEFQELSRESEKVVEQEFKEAPKKGVSTIVQDLRDRSFQEKMKESAREADDALADLESALSQSDEATRQARDILGEGQDGEDGGAGRDGALQDEDD